SENGGGNTANSCDLEEVSARRLRHENPPCSPLPPDSYYLGLRRLFVKNYEVSGRLAHELHFEIFND
ncbi:MAG: hypothetical protein WB707_13980, partial [Candidatus Acidiferrales bacterium]